MSYEPNYDYKSGQHYAARAAGQRQMGPLQAVGYDNRVKQSTVSDGIPFQGSVELLGFSDHQKTKYANKNDQMAQRRMKLQSISSD